MFKKNLKMNVGRQRVEPKPKKSMVDGGDGRVRPVRLPTEILGQANAGTVSKR